MSNKFDIGYKKSRKAGRNKAKINGPIVIAMGDNLAPISDQIQPARTVEPDQIKLVSSHPKHSSFPKQSTHIGQATIRWASAFGFLFPALFFSNRYQILALLILNSALRTILSFVNGNFVTCADSHDQKVK
jgi:hypothetical protein